jgi:pimeloyl-[acyl-carrier protein] synthase
MQNKTTNDINLLALRKHYTNPYGLYTRLREKDQIYFDETSQSWLVTSYEAITALLNDARFVSGLGTAANSSSPYLSSLKRLTLFMSGEAHKYMQNTILKSLALIAKQMLPTIRNFVRSAITTVYEKGEMDAVKDFASPISLFVIAHALGIPLQDQRELQQLERWSSTFINASSGYFSGEIQDIQKLENYFQQLIAEKRRSPSNDLVSALIKENNVFPHEEDLIANCMLILGGGCVRTTKLLGNGISFLTPQWEQLRSQLREYPQLPKLLGEELLRMVTPTRYVIREASTDVDLSSSFPGHHLIRRGQRVLLFLEAANYDPSVFSQPEQFHPHRRPNKHLAFGYGPHQCPGASLARAEIQIALEELFSLSDLRPKPGAHPVWGPNPNLGGFVSHPVVFNGQSVL